MTDTRRMDHLHPRWQEFLNRLGGPGYCDFRGEKWKCNGQADKPFATALLTEMGLSPDALEESLDFFEFNCGFCDCEILFNVSEADWETAFEQAAIGPHEFLWPHRPRDPLLGPLRRHVENAEGIP